MKLFSYQTIIIGFLISFILLISAITYSYKTSFGLYRSFGWVNHTYEVLSDLKNVMYDLAQAESNIRGYYVTADNEFIKAYNTEINSLYKNLNRLEVLTSYNDSQQKNLKLLRLKINERVDLFNESLKVKALSLDTRDFIESHLQKVITSSLQIAQLEEKIEQEERDLLIQRRDAAYDKMFFSEKVMVFIACTTLIIAILVIFIVFKDLKRRKETEKELIAINENKNKFFSIISHDLRGPVNASSQLVGLIMVSKGKENIPNTDDVLFHLQKSLNQISNLLDNLLKWSKLQMDKIEFKPEVFELEHILSKVIRDLKIMADIKSIGLKNLLDDGSIVEADKNMVDLILRNLINNAIKFTPKGGEILVSSKVVNNFLEIRVSDNGMGMSESIKNSIFKINSKITTKGTNNEEGSGLGLILCKEFVEKNNGKIWVESELGKGTTFIFTLVKGMDELPSALPKKILAGV